MTQLKQENFATFSDLLMLYIPSKMEGNLKLIIICNTYPEELDLGKEKADKHETNLLDLEY